MTERDIWQQLQQARDKAKQREDEELKRVDEASTAELQRSAGVRLAARQAVRETLDDILGE